MEIIAGGRGMGKTEELIRMMAQDPRSIMVCISLLEVDRLEKRYPEWKGRFITVDQILHGRLQGRHGFKPLVDNADMILQQLLRLDQPIQAVSMTGSVWRNYGFRD